MHPIVSRRNSSGGWHPLKRESRSGHPEFQHVVPAFHVATYDNAHMGYACSLNSQGDVVVNLLSLA